jgi:hypothetical protein
MTIPALHPTYLQRLASNLRSSILAVGGTPDESKLEPWAVLVHESMSGRGRNFHSVQHVFDVAGDSQDPLLILAAMFHDTVYYQVDGGLPDKQVDLIGDIIEERDGEVHLRDCDAAADPRLALVAAVFGFAAGQVLSPFAGLNEFLSTMLAARSLGDALPLSVLAEVAACIEATIPFRKADEQGRGPAERLHTHLEQANGDFSLGLSAAAIEAAVHRAVELANRDVGNFAYEDVAWFLDLTWKLLPESNVPLRSSAVYTIGEFQLALKKMEGFFSFLDPEVVFGSFRGRPDAATVEALTTRARRNLQVGRCYLRAKLSGMSLLAALAAKTGGDAPVSLFMGDLPGPGYRSIRLEDNLPAPREFAPGCQPEVYELLAVGRKSESRFDLRNSPLSAFLYAHLGDGGIDAVLEHAAHPMDDEHADAFLGALPAEVVRIVAHASAMVAVPRAATLEALGKG